MSLAYALHMKDWYLAKLSPVNKTLHETFLMIRKQLLDTSNLMASKIVLSWQP